MAGFCGVPIDVDRGSEAGHDRYPDKRCARVLNGVSDGLPVDVVVRSFLRCPKVVKSES
jgi:hypothetical protein